MKQVQITVIILAAIVSIASADGVAEEQNKDRTGSPDGANTCDNCHMGGGFDPTVSINVENSMAEEVLSIVPGETYELNITVDNFFPFPDAYGFQATALMQDLSNAGSFSNPGSNVQIENVDNMSISNRHVVEHNSPSFIGSFKVDWTAPLEGDSVYFYAAGVTANGNGEPEGDNGQSTSLTLPLSSPDGLVVNLLDALEIVNRTEELWISHTLLSSLEEISIYSIDGRLLFQSSNLGLPFALSKASIDESILLIVMRENGLESTYKLVSL